MGTNSVGCTEWERDFDSKTEQPFSPVKARWSAPPFDDAALITVKQTMLDAAERAVMKYPYFTAGEAAEIAKAVVAAALPRS